MVLQFYNMFVCSFGVYVFDIFNKSTYEYVQVIDLQNCPSKFQLNKL
jgi:hypothetical protein